MGCSVSSNGHFEPEKYDSIWNELPTKDGGRVEGKRNKTSKIMRLNIMSTFKDFRNERLVIHDLLEDREIIESCRSRGVSIQIEDMNAGQKASFEDPQSVQLMAHCLLESQMDNGNPYYIHLFGEVLGYVIRGDYSDQELLQRLGLQSGLSLSESALVLEKLSNPNAIYFRRDASFLREIPFHEPVFIDEDSNRDRANYLAESVQRKANNYHIYTCTTEGINNTYNKNVVFKGLEPLQSKIKEFILSHLASDFRGSSSSSRSDGEIGKSNEKRKRKHSKLNNQHETAVLKATAAAETNDVILISGDFGSGKSAVMAKLAKDRSAHLYSAGSTKTIKDEIDSKIKEICIDDIDSLPKEEIVAITEMIAKNKGKVFASARKTPKALIKKNGEIKLFLVQLAGIGDPDQIKKTLCQYLTFVSPQEEIETTISRTFDEGTMRIAEMIMEKTSARDENQMEEGNHSDGSWSVEKAKILGSIVRFGAKPSTAKDLVRHSTASVCEADLHLMEAEMRGHLLIGSLCILAIASNEGIEERQLRRLLSPEEELLPMTIRRKYKGLAYEYCSDRYGRREEVLALRWRYIRVRIGHYLQMVDLDRHALAISPVCRKAVYKRYLNNDQILQHFQRLMRSK